MSASAAPWSVKGIDPKAREIAKDLARRSGMTLGEWLNSMIMDEPEDDDTVATLPRRSPIPEPYDRRARSRRLDDAYTGPSLEVIADRLEAAERRSAEAIRAIEDAVSGLVRRLDRQENEQASLEHRFERVSEELRDGHQRLKTLEQTGTGVDEARLTSMTERLDQAQTQTQAALKALEISFANLDNRLLQTESKLGPDEAREASRFERLAETLSRQVEGNRIEMMRRLDVVEIESRADRLERAIQNVADHTRAAEQKSAAAVEAMGREVMRIAQNLNTRMERMEEGGGLETLGKSLSDKFERDLERHAQSVDQRLTRTDETHARAIERLGDEITRISDRLSDRIAASERRSAEAVDDIARRMAEHSERIEHRHQMHGDLAERIRQSEERTAQLIAEARESMEQRAKAPEPTIAPWSAAEAGPSDWRAAAFAEPGVWSDDDLDGLLDAAPFPAPRTEQTPPKSATPDPVEAEDLTDPLESELGAWVEARTLEVETPGPFGSRAERADFGSLSQPLADDDLTADILDDEGPVTGQSPDQTTDEAAQDPLVFEALLDEAEEAAPVPTETRQDEVEDSLIFAAEQNDFDRDVSILDADLDEPRPADEANTALDDWLEAETTTVSDLDDPVQALHEADHQDPATDAPRLEADDAAPKLDDETSAEQAEPPLSTRDALLAARAAITETPEPGLRSAFGLKRKGGKSKLQEKLDKKASGEGSGLRRLFGASALAALVVGGGYGFLKLSDPAQMGNMGSNATAQTPDPDPIAAVALATTPTEATAATDVARTEGANLFERAVTLLDRGDDNGLAPLKQAADLGHPAAQLRLAGLYEDGASGLPADPVQSRNWARRAAEGGDAQAMHYYAMQLYDGIGGPQNRTAALGWLKRAAEAGRVDSQYNVARLYEMGDTGVEKNPVEAFKWYMIAARRGDQQALAAVQRLTPVTDAESRRKAREAADAFHVDPVA